MAGVKTLFPGLTRVERGHMLYSVGSDGPPGSAYGKDGLVADAPTKAAAHAKLQEVYARIAFLEMKRDDYDWSVRAPQ